MRTHSTTPRLGRLTVALLAVALLAAALQLTGPLAAAATEVIVVTTVVPGSGCETAPISEARYAAAAADPTDDAEFPAPIPYAPPDGTPADAATAGRVRTTVEQLAACVNEGRLAAAVSLFTDGYLAGNIRGLGLLNVPLDDAEPTPAAADEQLAVRSVTDVVVLADGRVAALVLLSQGERTGPELTSVMTFAEVDGALLIDGWLPVTLSDDDPPPGPCDGPTPTDPACVPTPTPAPEAWDRVSGPGYAGVIAPLELAPVFRTGYGEAASGWWLPTAEEVAALEAGLPDYLRTFSDDRTIALADKIGTYARQYAGLVIEGRALIFVNALCEDPTDGGLTTGPVFVDDGGDCFFQLYYEPSTGGFRQLTINGEG